MVICCDRNPGPLDLLISPFLTYIMYFHPVNAFLYILRNFYNHEILSVNCSFSADFFQRV